MINVSIVILCFFTMCIIRFTCLRTFPTEWAVVYSPVVNSHELFFCSVRQHSIINPAFNHRKYKTALKISNIAIFTKKGYTIIVLIYGEVPADSQPSVQQAGMMEITFEPGSTFHWVNGAASEHLDG